ncbi:MAG: hypothetical protein IJ214_05005, partial [Clostridia bacterium]|nr:hypothetical protein [Clostridia bacterium]
LSARPRIPRISAHRNNSSAAVRFMMGLLCVKRYWAGVQPDTGCSAPAGMPEAQKTAASL